MKKIVVVTDDNFGDIVKEGVVLVDFWAEWCGPCKMIAPMLDEIAEENEQITIGKMDVDTNSAKPNEFSIRSIPTMIIFKDGEPVDKLIGAIPKNEIISKLNKHLSINVVEENTYFQLYHDVRKELVNADEESGELKAKIKSLNVEIQNLRLELQGKVNEIIDLALTNEDDCCDSDCTCKGDYINDNNEDLLP